MKLKLHEAIAVILLSKEDRKAHIQEIADEINKRNPPLAQVLGVASLVSKEHNQFVTDPR